AAASSAADNFSRIPSFSVSDLRPDADYVHICYNNTIYGTKYPAIPDTGAIPLVADMSSCIISEPVDVSRFGLIYAGAQKNMAPAGLTVVIVREDLIGKARPETPTMLDYKIMADNDSMYNTPPCYCIYVAKLVYEWILSMGGLEEMKRRNERKASLLYDYLDSQSYYTAPVDPASRSMMNVTFVTGDKDLDAKFAKEAAAAGLANLKGHRSVGGMRASIYNAMPYEGVEALVAFMKKFAEENPKG
ncbi:MAG: 3-phosphoserine/phosphohydroxythreonine transaminase, partial [Clostridia bacterium]|nr:3-phosphoserine/phosphohydroxythreonine transaminase [Clostridia bacterium]